jgi:hypothetical protein
MFRDGDLLTRLNALEERREVRLSVESSKCGCHVETLPINQPVINQLSTSFPNSRWNDRPEAHSLAMLVPHVFNTTPKRSAPNHEKIPIAAQ